MQVSLGQQRRVNRRRKDHRRPHRVEHVVVVHQRFTNELKSEAKEDALCFNSLQAQHSPSMRLGGKAKFPRTSVYDCGVEKVHRASAFASASSKRRQRRTPLQSNMAPRSSSRRSLRLRSPIRLSMCSLPCLRTGRRRPTDWSCYRRGATTEHAGSPRQFGAERVAARSCGRNSDDVRPHRRRATGE